MSARLQMIVDVGQLRARFGRGIAATPRVLDRFVKRGANEFARAEKIEAPKALTGLANSIQVRANGIADHSVLPTMKYAAAVNNGGRPHWAPLRPLMDWLRVTKRVTDPWELHDRARGLQRFIARKGTKANPFVQRTRVKMDDRVIALLREGVRMAIQQGFNA